MISARRLAIVFCVAIPLLFGATSYLATLRMAPTIDEPICALAGYDAIAPRGDGDLRLDIDNPPLWKYLAALPNLNCQLRPIENPDQPSYENGFRYSSRRLFQTPGNDGLAFINRARAAMVLLGVLLAAAVARWAWQLAGATAAVVATTLYGLDPNFIAHASLVKADVTVALLMFCIAQTTWHIGRRATLLNVLSLGLLCGAAVTVKFNGLVPALMPVPLLIARALAASEWNFLGKPLRSRPRRLLAAAATACVLGVITFATIWAAYQFRFAPARTGEKIDFAAELDELARARARIASASPGNVPATEPTPSLSELSLARAELPPIPRIAAFFERHHLLPQAWLAGLVSIYRSSTTAERPTYLFGEVSDTGWWYYLPLAMLFKTPLTVLLAGAAAVPLGVVVLRRRAARGSIAPQIGAWSAACLYVPPAVYAIFAMTSHAQSGIRYVLPLYPPIYVGIGIVAARLREIVASAALFDSAIAILAAALLYETASVFPSYISYFNRAARPDRLWLLSDSNFDWGQDLLAVVRWRRAHPDVPIYLGYYGMVDPASLDLDYSILPGGYGMGRFRNDPLPRRGRAALIVGATLLQGPLSPPQIREFYKPLRDREPDEMIGDSYFVYYWPLSP